MKLMDIQSCFITTSLIRHSQLEAPDLFEQMCMSKPILDSIGSDPGGGPT